MLVIGMHRSGTSAVTGALGHLGLSLPAPNDLVSGRPDNPIHYESQALTVVDDALLRAWGGSWSAPPLLPAGWERAPTTLTLVGRARDAAVTAYPGGGPLAWKDPRLCLLLPFWRSVLRPPVLQVFVWRSPLSVARSLRARQRFTLSHGLALWHAYIRGALAALAGTEVMVVRFEDLVASPQAPIESVARWLDSRGRPPRIPECARSRAGGARRLCRTREPARRRGSARWIRGDGYDTAVPEWPSSRASGGHVARAPVVGDRRNLAAPRPRGHLRQIPEVREVS